MTNEVYDLCVFLFLTYNSKCFLPSTKASNRITFSLAKTIHIQQFTGGMQMTVGRG